MISTITLPPALDHYVETEDLRVDDATRVEAERLFAGGKGIDVSRAIRHLGGDSMALGFMGGPNGDILVHMRKSEGVTPYCTPISQETRRDVIISNVRRDTQTILNARGPSITPDEWASVLTHLHMLDLRGAFVVLSGSLPRGLSHRAYGQIISLVQRRGAKVILDADGRALRAGLKAKPFPVTPNLNELRRVPGRRLRAEGQILSAARALNRAGVKIVLVSLGRKGLLMVTRSKRLRAIPPSVMVRSTVGTGDSTVAGFVFMYAAGKTFEECVRWATAAGTAATLAPGNPLCRLRDVQRLVPRTRVEKIGAEAGR
ncbi:MAG: 1-phosphofructokinase family hexose kinase [candidate division NC10 bacterium]